MSVLKTGAMSPDVSHGTLKSTIWTAVECHTAIICASLPMLKSTMAKLFPRFFPHTQQASNTEVENEEDPTSSQSSTPVNEDCEAASDPPAWLYKYDPASLKQFMEETEGHHCAHDRESPLPDFINQDVPKVYCPHEGSPPPVDAITKTTDIRVHFGRKDDEDSASSDSIFRYGGISQVATGPRQSRKSLSHRR